MKKKSKPLIDKDGEVREITAADMKYFRPARLVDPKLVAAYKAGTLKLPTRYRGQRGKQKVPVKAVVSLRLDKEVLAYFRAKGKGWQTRMNDALKAFVDVAR